MLRKVRILVCLAFVMFAALTHAAKHPDNVVPQTIAAYLKANKIPGAAVLIYQNGVPYSYYFGEADVENKVPVSQKTIFEIGSISKIMTTLLLAQEVDFAKVLLTDSVRKYLPDLPEDFDKVTLQALATHTSGLAFNVPKAIHTTDELDGYLRKAKPGESVDELWSYSNLGMGILSLALEKETQKSFSELYKRHILYPLGMTPITTEVPERFKKYVATGYDKYNRAVAAATGLLPAATDVKMTAGDMQRFLSAAIGLSDTPERILYPMRMSQVGYLKLPNKLQGLAWQIHPLKDANKNDLINEPNTVYMQQPVTEKIKAPIFDGSALHDKTGATPGFRAYIAVIPNKKSGIVILANKNSVDNGIVKAGRKILFEITS